MKRNLLLYLNYFIDPKAESLLIYIDTIFNPAADFIDDQIDKLR